MGSIWGFGHGITSFIIGMIGFSLKDYVFQSDMNYIMCIKNVALGGTLLVIGTMGMREAIHSKMEEDEQHDQNEQQNENKNNQLSKTKIFGLSRRYSLYVTYFFNGCIMGLTWDGLPSLAPSIALPEFSSVLTFLTFYCIGTAFFMSIVSGIVSHASILLGDVAGSNFPISLALIASIFSIVSGCYWLLYAGLVAVVGDDESLIPYHIYFSCIAIICSGISSILVIYTYVHNSLFGASLLSPILYYWKILIYNDFSSLWNQSNSTINKFGVHTV